MSNYYCPRCSNQVWVKDRGLVVILCEHCQQKMEKKVE